MFRIRTAVKKFILTLFVSPCCDTSPPSLQSISSLFSPWPEKQPDHGMYAACVNSCVQETNEALLLIVLCIRNY